MLDNRIVEFESLKNNILLRIEKIKTDVESMVQNKLKRCEDCEINIHRASYSRHLKSKRHLEKKQLKPRTKINKDENKKKIKKIIKSNINFQMIY